MFAVGGTATQGWLAGKPGPFGALEPLFVGPVLGIVVLVAGSFAPGRGGAPALGETTASP